MSTPAAHSSGCKREPRERHVAAVGATPEHRARGVEAERIERAVDRLQVSHRVEPLGRVIERRVPLAVAGGAPHVGHYDRVAGCDQSLDLGVEQPHAPALRARRAPTTTTAGRDSVERGRNMNSGIRSPSKLSTSPSSGAPSASGASSAGLWVSRRVSPTFEVVAVDVARQARGGQREVEPRPVGARDRRLEKPGVGHARLGQWRDRRRARRSAMS